MSARISQASVSKSVATRGARSTAPATTAINCSLILAVVQVVRPPAVAIYSITLVHREISHSIRPLFSCDDEQLTLSSPVMPNG